MKGLGISVFLIGIAIVLLAALILTSKPFPKACTEEAKLCPDGSYVGRDPYNNCEFRPCLGETTTITTITSAKNDDLDELVINPALYVNSYVKVSGLLVKNVGAFFGATYHLQSGKGIDNFKNLGESSTGIALASSKIDLENFVQYTFNGTGYTRVDQYQYFYVEVLGFVRDRGNVVDSPRYVLEVDDIVKREKLFID